MLHEDKKAWDKVFKEQGRFFEEPHEFMPEIVKLFSQYKVNKVLDLGCGTGRHTVYLAKHGLHVFALDNSEEAIKESKNWLAKESLKADFIKQEMTEHWPYADNFFDAILSVNVIHHGRISEIQKVIAEIERTLRPGGVVVVSMPKKRNQAERFEKVEKRTFVPLDGCEKGLPHHYFTKLELHAFFSAFKYRSIKMDNTDHCFLFGIRK
ncbi:MAG: class I SAM-dependent methyltransferase [Gammaproteobacteria bacterium]